MKLFDILNHLDAGNMQVYDEAGADQAQIARDLAWIVPQWMTGSTSNAAHKFLVIAFDEMCNPGWNRLDKHPGLRARLLSSIRSPGTRHKFYQPQHNRKVNHGPLFDLIQSEIEDIRPEEVALWVQHSTLEELTALMDRGGIPLDERSDLCKLYEAMTKQK